jgi:hypothetical protein
MTLSSRSARCIILLSLALIALSLASPSATWAAPASADAAATLLAALQHTAVAPAYQATANLTLRAAR